MQLKQVNIFNYNIYVENISSYSKFNFKNYNLYYIIKNIKFHEFLIN